MFNSQNFHTKVYSNFNCTYSIESIYIIAEVVDQFMLTPKLTYAVAPGYECDRNRSFRIE
jgi:hypothetical protein